MTQENDTKATEAPDMPAPKDDNINALCIKWVATRETEKMFQRERVKLEDKLIALIGDLPAEGTRNATTDLFIATATARMNRKLDEGAWHEIADEIPERLWPVRTKLEIDTRKLKDCAVNEPELYRKICKAISSKPAKVGIKIEELETLQ